MPYTKSKTATGKVVLRSKGRIVGQHDSEEKADAQIAAIEASKRAKRKR